MRSPKGKLNYPSIQIVFHLKDLPLALLIQKELGVGSLSSPRWGLTLGMAPEGDHPQRIEKKG